MSELTRRAHQVAARDAAWPRLPILQADMQTGEIVDVHQPAADIFGYAVEELLGQSVELLVPEALRESHVHWRQDVQVPRTRLMGQGRKVMGRHKDGSLKPVFIGLTESSANGIAVAFIVDLTGVEMQQSPSSGSVPVIKM